MTRAATATPNAQLSALRDILADVDRERKSAELDRLREARSLKFKKIGAARRPAGEESGEPEPVA
jgi:hypothetical protein